MCNQFTLHQLRIDTGRTKFEQKTDDILLRLWIFWTKNTRIQQTLTWIHHVLHGTCREWGRHHDMVYCVDLQLAQQKGFKFSQTRSNAIIFYHTLPAYCIPKVVMMGSGEIKNEKVFASLWPLSEISSKDNSMQELGSQVARHGENSQQTQTKPPTTNLSVRIGRLVSTEQPSSSSVQEIDTHFSIVCESTIARTWRLVYNCVPVSVERSVNNKDADENVGADQTSAQRLVSGQPTGLFTRHGGIDIVFRVSGLPHAVVKQVENFRVRELVKKSHPHRKDLQVDLQQSNVYNPLSENRRRWFVTWAM